MRFPVSLREESLAFIPILIDRISKPVGWCIFHEKDIYDGCRSPSDMVESTEVKKNCIFDIANFFLRLKWRNFAKNGE